MNSVLDVVLGAGKATANKAIGLPVVCVDLDGVLASYSGTGWQGVESIGEPIPGAVEFMDELSREFSITVFTTRTKADLPARDEEDGEYTPEDLAAIVRDWLDSHQFSYDEVYVGQGKPLAVAYLDDRAVTCVPEEAGQTAYQNAIASARKLAERNKKSLLASAFGVASPALWVARGVWNYQAAIGTKSRLKIRWTTGDPSPNRCKECQSLIGQVVRLGEAFTTAKGRQVYNPPEPHPACRCRIEVVTGSKSSVFGAIGAKSSLFVGKDSFFATCERDEQGHCIAGTGGGPGGGDKLADKKNPEAKPVLSSHAKTTVSAMHKAIFNSDLSKEQRSQYAAAISKVASRMPDRAHKAIAGVAKNIRFFSDKSSLGDGVLEEVKSQGLLGKVLIGGLKIAVGGKENLKYLLGLGNAVGGYMERTKSILMDGGTTDFVLGHSQDSSDPAPVQAHEIGHAIDYGLGSLSDTPEWKEIWEEEINKKENPLNDYATTNTSEGFAEFCRAIYTGDIELYEVARALPKASKFFMDQRIWPKVTAKTKSSIDGMNDGSLLSDLFDKSRRVSWPDGHADIAIGGEQDSEAGEKSRFAFAGATKSFHGHDFASTQFNIPPDLSSQITTFAQNLIPEADLAYDGFETTPHITVRYGLHDSNPSPVVRLVRDAGMERVVAVLGLTDFFAGDEQDVVIIRVKSPDLGQLNSLLTAVPHTNTHPTYQPHITLAYVRAGLGGKYQGKDTFDGVTVSFGKMLFSSPDDQITEIPLTRQAGADDGGEGGDKSGGDIIDLLRNRPAMAKSSFFTGKAGESFFANCERDDQGHCVAGSGSGGAAGSDDAGATGGEAGEPARPDTPFQKWQDRQEKRDNIREAIAGADTSKFEAKELRAAWDAIRGDMSGMSADEANAKIDAAAAASSDYFDDIVNSLSDLDFDTEKEAAALTKLAEKFKAGLAKKADAWKKVNEAADQAAEEKNKLEEAGSGAEEPELEDVDEPEEEEYPDEPDEPDDDGGDEPKSPGRNDTYTGRDALGNPVVDAPMYDDDEEYEDAVSDFKKEHAEWKETNDKYKKDYAQYEKDSAAYEKETAAIDKRNEKAQAAYDKAVEAAEKKYDKEYAAYEKAEEKFEAAVAKADEKISKLQDKAIDLFSEFDEADDEALDALAEKQQEILEAIEAKVDAEEEKDEEPEEEDADVDYSNAQLEQWKQSAETKKQRAAELEKYNKEHGEPKSGLAQSVVGKSAVAIAHSMKCSASMRASGVAHPDCGCCGKSDLPSVLDLAISHSAKCGGPGSGVPGPCPEGGADAAGSDKPAAAPKPKTAAGAFSGDIGGLERELEDADPGEGVEEVVAKMEAAHDAATEFFAFKKDDLAKYILEEQVPDRYDADVIERSKKDGDFDRFKGQVNELVDGLQEAADEVRERFLELSEEMDNDAQVSQESFDAFNEAKDELDGKLASFGKEFAELSEEWHRDGPGYYQAEKDEAAYEEAEDDAIGKMESLNDPDEYDSDEGRLDDAGYYNGQFAKDGSPFRIGKDPETGEWGHADADDVEGLVEEGWMFPEDKDEPSKSALAGSVVGLAIAHTLKARYATLNEALAASKPRPRSLRGVRRWLSEWKEIPGAATVVEHFPDLRQQTAWTCGAIALEAVARFNNVGGTGEEFGPPTNDAEGGGNTEAWFAAHLGTNPRDGTPPKRIIDLAKRIGLRVRFVGQMTAVRLRHFIEQGVPVIVLVQAWGDPAKYKSADEGHYVIAIGFDGEHVYFEDPSLARSRGYMTWDQFELRWHDKGAGGEIYRNWGLALVRADADEEQAEEIKSSVSPAASLDFLPLGGRLALPSGIIVSPPNSVIDGPYILASELKAKIEARRKPALPMVEPDTPALVAAAEIEEEIVAKPEVTESPSPVPVVSDPIPAAIPSSPVTLPTADLEKKLDDLAAAQVSKAEEIIKRLDGLAEIAAMSAARGTVQTMVRNENGLVDKIITEPFVVTEGN